MHYSILRRSAAGMALAVLAVLPAGCADAPVSPEPSVSLSEFHSYVPDGSSRFLLRTSTGAIEEVALTHRTSGTTRTFTLTRNGTAVLAIRETWRPVGNGWERAHRTVDAFGMGAAAMQWDGSAVNDAAMTRANILADHVLDDIEAIPPSDGILMTDGGCGGKALKVLAAGFAASAAVAGAIAVPTPVTVLAAIAAIAYAASVYDEYIKCLQDAYM